MHMFLWQVSTIKSHDGGKRGHFGNHKVISYYLQLTRAAQPPGQLSLYLLNDINSLLSEINKGIIALTVWRLGTSSQLQMIADDLVIAKIPSFSTVMASDG